MKYQAILFDADGVLIKSQRLFSDRLEEVYGIPVERLQPFFKGVFRQCSLGKADLKEELAKVIGEWGWQGTVDELFAFWFSEGTVIDEEVAELVRSVREQGVKTYMATDQEKYRGEHLRSTLGHGVLFDEIFFSAEIGCSKKDQAFFTHVDATIIIDPQRVLFIDDDEENVASAKAFGYDAYHYTNLADLKKVLSA